MKKVILYIHGKGGSYLEAEQYKKNCLGFDIIGIDYNDYIPWIVQNQIQLVIIQCITILLTIRVIFKRIMCCIITRSIMTDL